MIQKLIYTIVLSIIVITQVIAQRDFSNNMPSPDGDGKMDKGELLEKMAIPSVIKNWELTDYGARIVVSELDTTLNFFHNYFPFNKRSFSNTFTGGLGGAYISNDFFRRNQNSDFYFMKSFDAYALFPEGIKYFNTTTPYTLLDYSQSENRETRNETRFNVFHSQNINEKLNISFFYNQARYKGYYDNDDGENKYHNIGFFGSYQSDKLIVHSDIIFNRVKTEEDGGVTSGTNLNSDLEAINLVLTDARAELSNNTFYLNTEYLIGKYIEEETDEEIIETFIPRSGFIYELEYSGNKRNFYKDDIADNYFNNIYLNFEDTEDETGYNRLSNIFQIKFYEAPDRKYTFGKRAYIGHDQLFYKYPVMANNSQEVVFNVDEMYSLEDGPFMIQGFTWDIIPSVNYSFRRKQFNSYLGGAIYRNEGKFWQWNASGKMYFGGQKAGQTEVEGYINKPLTIGKDTTSLRIDGSLKTLVPDYFEQNYYSNHFRWKNDFKNTKEMIIRGKINSKRYKTTVGANYALIGNYIYNNEEALPDQANGEMLILSAYLNKDFISDHWLIRAQTLWQSSSSDYVHLPDFSAFLSINYRTLVSKVMHVQLGIDTRYNTEFYADAYEISTGRFYIQNEQKIGNYPFVDLHVNLKLKRTRAFFNLMNATSGLLDGNYWTAPSYPLFKRTYRIGVAWSFYD